MASAVLNSFARIHARGEEDADVWVVHGGKDAQRFGASGAGHPELADGVAEGRDARLPRRL